MKLITFFVFVGIIHVSASVNAQNETMKLERGSMTVKQILTEIMLQHQYDIFYSDDLVDTRQAVEITKTSVSVDELLKTMLEGKYTYEVLGKTIIIRPLIPSTQEQKPVAITGTVRDERGGPLPGVTVLVKGSTLGVSTEKKFGEIKDIAYI